MEVEMRVLILLILLISCEVYSLDYEYKPINIKLVVVNDYANNVPVNIIIDTINNSEIKTFLIDYDGFTYDLPSNVGYHQIQVFIDINKDGYVNSGDYYHMSELQVFEDTEIEVSEWRVIK
jgi:hypothetical protein